MKTRAEQWLVLDVVLMGTFMAILDVAIVNVAIPSIRSYLHASFGEVEHVNICLYAHLCMSSGHWGWLGDLYGRKSLFMGRLACYGTSRPKITDRASRKGEMPTQPCVHASHQARALRQAFRNADTRGSG